MGALAGVGALLLLWPGLSGARVPLFEAYLPPSTTVLAGAPTRANEPAWHTDDLAAARAEAERTGQPLFVDFTGYTCTNCRAMEANVFPTPEVAPLLTGGFVRGRLVAEAERLGVRLLACGMSLGNLGIAPDDLADGIEVVPNGLLHALERQADGFVSVEL